MADITMQAASVFEDGHCAKAALFAVNNCTAGDTVDVGAHFRVIKRAGLVSATGTTIGAVSASGTVLTVPAGPAADGCWLLVVGVAV
jgi:hypothetical protein